MTWGDFKAAVIEELSTDGNRRGIEALRTRAMRDAVIDLQRFIRAFRDGHTTTYTAANLTLKDFAHLGTLPAQAKPKAFYTVSLVPKTDGSLPDPNCARNRMDYVAWQDRQHMICDQRGRRHYQYAISPFSDQFMVHPLINDQTYLLVVWEGLKLNFADSDVVPFPEQAAEAVAAYVKWKILLLIDKRIDLAREWFDRAKNTGIYPGLRLALAREQRESQDADGKDQEYVDGSAAPGYQSGFINLNIGDISGAIVFPTAFSSAPIVRCWIVMPDSSGFDIEANPDFSTVTTLGFTGLLAAAIPEDGYRLNWSAQPSTS